MSPQAAEDADSTTPPPPTAATRDEYPFVSHLTHGLEDCDWDQLQEKYADAMEQHGRVEENLRLETAKLMEVSITLLVYNT